MGRRPTTIDLPAILKAWRLNTSQTAALADVRPSDFGVWSHDPGQDFSAEQVWDLALTRKWHRTGGVYRITFSPTGAIYIGASRDLRHRWREHLHELRHGRHFAPGMQMLYREHGPSAFWFAVLEFVPWNFKIKDRELHWMARLKPTLNPGSKCVGLERLKAQGEHC